MYRDIDKAYHEAGHTVAAHRFNLNFQYVTINPSEKYPEGHVYVNWPCKRRDGSIRTEGLKQNLLDAFSVSCMAGPAAALAFCEERVESSLLLHCGPSDDCKEAIEVLRRTRPRETFEEKLERCADESAALVAENWAAIDALAQALVVRRCIHRDEARAIIAKAESPTKPPFRYETEVAEALLQLLRYYAKKPAS